MFVLFLIVNKYLQCLQCLSISLDAATAIKYDRKNWTLFPIYIWAIFSPTIRERGSSWYSHLQCIALGQSQSDGESITEKGTRSCLLQLVKGWSEPAAIDAREERQACPQDRRVSLPATASVLCKGGSFHKSYFQLKDYNVPPTRSVKKVDCEMSEEPAESALQCFSGWPAQQLPPTVIFFLHFCRNNLMLHRLDPSLGTIEIWKCWLNCLPTITSNSGRHLLGTRSKDCVLNRRRPTTLPLPAVVAPVKGGVLRCRWSSRRTFTDQRFFP